MVYLVLQVWQFLQSIAEWTRWSVKIWGQLWILSVLLFSIAGRNKEATTPSECGDPSLPQLSDTARAFSMGFTRWPHETTAADLERMNRFTATHGDLTAHHFVMRNAALTQMLT
jgi:hypothetical protein